MNNNAIFEAVALDGNTALVHFEWQSVIATTTSFPFDIFDSDPNNSTATNFNSPLPKNTSTVSNVSRKGYFGRMHDNISQWHTRQEKNSIAFTACCTYVSGQGDQPLSGSANDIAGVIG